MSPTLQFLIIAFETLVRVAVPFLLVFGGLYLLKRRLEPRVNGAAQRVLALNTWLLSGICFVALAVIGIIGYSLVTNQFMGLLMLFRDVIVLVYMFFVRIFAPIAALYLAGTWLKRKLDPTAARAPVSSTEKGSRLRRLHLPALSFRASLAVLFLVGLWTSAIGIAVSRFFFGLAYTTNLTDETPWGLWIAFDVVSGVALAAGGFVMAGTVHVFNLKKYHPIVRPAMLTALLGYLLVIVGLLFDLGRWYNIWHPIFGFWNIHSPMLEVAWCVVLYTTVLFVEFSPAIFERFNLTRPLKIVRAMTIPVVILGMVLSTLHQSSLGSLFLIAPEKINPLWYTPLLPIFFLISAIAVGLGMTIVEANVSARAFGRQVEHDLLKGLGRIASYVIGVYLMLRFIDLAVRGAFTFAFTPGFHSTIFWVEILIGFALPMGLMAIHRVRAIPGMVFLSGGLLVAGVIMNRLNTGLLGWWAYASNGPIYVPSLSEVTITLSLLAAGVVGFGLAAKFLPVFEPEPNPAHT